MLPFASVRRVVVPCLLFMLILAVAQVALGQRVMTPDQHGEWHRLRAADYDANTRVAPFSSLHKQAGAQTATINVRYIGFPPNAREAFQKAVDIWSTHLQSSVVINVEATWESLDTGVLGSAGPALVAFSAGDGVRGVEFNVWYPIAIGEAIAGESFNDNDGDIFASFNSDFPNWYLGTDGNTPAGFFDLTTVVLHELGHGLGFTGSFSYDNGEVEDGVECGPSDTGCWGFGTQGFPIIFDLFAEDANEVSLLNEEVYPNPSVALGNVLQSGDVFFESELVRVSNDDVPVDLYAPNNFEPGSSFSHLDERIFPPGSPNSLMTPFLGRAESIFSPGPVTCAIFQEIGWMLGPDCLGLLGGGIVSFDAELSGSGALVTWTIANVEEFDFFILEQSFFGDDFIEVARRNATGSGIQDFSVRLDGLGPGRYQFRLTQVRNDGTEVRSSVAEVFIPIEGEAAISEIFPNPFKQEAHFTLQVLLSQRVRIEMYNAYGQRVAVLLDRQVSPRELIRVSLNNLGLASGVYYIQIQAREFSETRTAVVTR